MAIQRFHFTSYQSESSRDSNAQLTHYEFAGGVLTSCEEWTGYHPRGGGGRMPASHYRLDNAQLAALEAAFVERDLLRSQSETSGAESHRELQRDTRSYGITLELETSSGVVKIESSYTTSGPRVEAMEDRPLSLKLKELQDVLQDLTFSAEAIVLTAEEREAEAFFNRHGYRKDELPKTISRLIFGTKLVTKVGSTELDEKPFYFQMGSAPDFFIIRQLKVDGRWKEERVTYKGKPEFFERMADLAVRYKLHIMPEHTYYSNDDLPYPKTHRKVTWEAQFNANSNWWRKFEFQIGESPEIHARYSGEDSLLVRFEGFLAGLEELLKSDLVEVVKTSAR